MADRPIDVLVASHSAEHVLNAVMQRDFGTGRSMEVHFGEKKTKVDYRVDRPLDEDDLLTLEAAVNAEIAKDHPVTSFVVSRAEAEGRYDMGKLPDSAESIRIVQIGDLDAIPCIGEHVERTSQIGRFEIASAGMRGADRIRIRFRLHDRPKGAV
jgi:Ser-tRNA(Ala) deacylase AlaX